ncbi:MAG: hypothetical protein E6514_07770, partial [Alloscardovia omnicolens]|nr:hypothetical protein [Alloscardovia omnicolens]
LEFSNHHNTNQPKPQTKEESAASGSEQKQYTTTPHHATHTPTTQQTQPLNGVSHTTPQPRGNVRHYPK